MDEAPFDLESRDGDKLLVRCMRCGARHRLPPMAQWPHHLGCTCGNEADFMLGPAAANKVLLDALAHVPDALDEAHRRVRPSEN